VNYDAQRICSPPVAALRAVDARALIRKTGQMLFTSGEFLFLYLPVTLIFFFLTARLAGPRPAAWFLVLASFAFYGCWRVEHTLLLLASIAFNYVAGNMILDARERWPRKARRVLIGAIAVDLLALAYFKYANFFLEAAGDLTGHAFGSLAVQLPLGISFFTFTQIAYLVDVYRGKVVERKPAHYALFVSYFPHLVAGPVLHHAEMMPQFAQPGIYRPQLFAFTIGMAFLCLGLAKKVLIADTVAPAANHAFEHVVHTGLPAASAWQGVLAYTAQIYFDFSGYSDMAVGLSLLIGVRLPYNFNSPYRATSISEFWRRWHMTLSRFLRDYLYITLGGNRRGKARRYVNLLVTMLLGGLLARRRLDVRRVGRAARDFPRRAPRLGLGARTCWQRARGGRRGLAARQGRGDRADARVRRPRMGILPCHRPAVGVPDARLALRPCGCRLPPAGSGRSLLALDRDRVRDRAVRQELATAHRRDAEQLARATARAGRAAGRATAARRGASGGDRTACDRRGVAHGGRVHLFQLLSVMTRSSSVRITFSLAAGIVACLLAIELLLRFLPVQNGLFGAEPREDWPLHRLVPNSTFTDSAGWNFVNVRRGRVNDFGFVSPFDYAGKHGGIAVLGNSFVAATMNEYADTLQGSLPEYLSSPQVAMGFGVAGQHLPDYLAMARLIGERFEPDWAVIVVTRRDFSAGFRADPGYCRWARSGDYVIECMPQVHRSALRKWVRELATVRYVRSNLKLAPGNLIRLERAPATGPDEATCRSAELAESDRRLLSGWLGALAPALRIPPSHVILVVDSDRVALYAPPATDPAPACPTRDDRADAFLRVAAERRGIHVIDSGPVFARHVAETHERLDHSPHDAHWNGAAHRLMAQEVARIVERTP
jgi:D-alanyl-lipoteichoic acid acyltransferase DltB (MBOAT superfamily)